MSSSTQATTESTQDSKPIRKGKVDMYHGIVYVGTDVCYDVTWTDGTRSNNKVGRHLEMTKADIEELVKYMYQQDIKHHFHKEIQAWLKDMKINYEEIKQEVDEEAMQNTAVRVEKKMASARSKKSARVKKAKANNTYVPDIGQKQNHNFGKGTDTVASKKGGIVKLRAPSKTNDDDETVEVNSAVARDANNKGKIGSNMSKQKKEDVSKTPMKKMPAGKTPAAATPTKKPTVVKTGAASKTPAKASQSTKSQAAVGSSEDSRQEAGREQATAEEGRREG